MDPRTFLPPPRIEVARPPSPGDRAPTPELGGRKVRTAVVAFLRHPGCPFAEATARRLTQAATAHPYVQWIAVGHASEEPMRRWAEDVGLEHVTLVSDPRRALYAAWGVGTTSLGHFAGLRSLREAGRLARRGIRNRHPHGSRWQGAGTFAVDGDGVVAWRHLPAHAGDLPDLEAAAAAARPR